MTSNFMVGCMVSAGILSGSVVAQECYRVANYGTAVWGTMESAPCWIECTADITRCHSGTEFAECDNNEQANLCAKGVTIILPGGMTDCVGPFTHDTIDTSVASAGSPCGGGPGEP